MNLWDGDIHLFAGATRCYGYAYGEERIRGLVAGAKSFAGAAEARLDQSTGVQGQTGRVHGVDHDAVDGGASESQQVCSAGKVAATVLGLDDGHREGGVTTVVGNAGEEFEMLADYHHWAKV